MRVIQSRLVRYAMAVLVAPLGVLMARKPGLAAVNLVIWIMVPVAGVIHAVYVVSDAEQERWRDREARRAKAHRSMVLDGHDMPEFTPSTPPEDPRFNITLTLLGGRFPPESSSETPAALKLLQEALHPTHINPNHPSAYPDKVQDVRDQPVETPFKSAQSMIVKAEPGWYNV